MQQTQGLEPTLTNRCNDQSRPIAKTQSAFNASGAQYKRLSRHEPNKPQVGERQGHTNATINLSPSKDARQIREHSPLGCPLVTRGGTLFFFLWFRAKQAHQAQRYHLPWAQGERDVTQHQHWTASGRATGTQMVGPRCLFTPPR